MCSRVSCQKCQKPTWTGCGAHVEQALAGVPKDARCRCRDQAAAVVHGQVIDATTTLK